MGKKKIEPASKETLDDLDNNITKDPVLIEQIINPTEETSAFLDQAEENPAIVDEIPAELKPGEFVIRHQALPTRPIGENITIAPTAPPMIQPSSVPTRKGDIKKIFRDELIDKNVALVKPQLVNPSTAPRTSLNYSRRNVALINDINNVIDRIPASPTDNPVNRESRGVFRINKNKPIKN